MSYLQLLALAAPETIVVLAALAVLTADLTALRGLEPRFRRWIGGMIAGMGCVAAIGWMLAMPQQADFQSGMLVVDPLTRLVKVGLLALALFTLVVSLEADFTSHQGEYFALVLLATVGMMLLVSAEDILMVFLSLELTSLSLYVLTAFNKQSRFSAEAALKYFLFGGMSAAFTLFGFSLLYGLSGATNLGQIAAAIRGRELDPLLLVALVMTVLGFGFKLAAAPFHLWAPDVYEGAPVPSAAFVASGSKVAGFFIFAKVMLLGFAGAEGSGSWHAFRSGWIPLVAVVAALSMVLGNLVAIVQVSVRRLVAYSAVAHGGYTLLGLLAHNSQGLEALVYYAFTYALTVLGTFAVVAVVEQETGGSRLQDFAGLSRRAPGLSLCLLIFLLSLAGLPPLAGFLGKFYLFAATLQGDPHSLGSLWLVILAVGMSAVSLYYYLQVLKQVYVAGVPSGAAPMRTPWSIQVAVSVLAFAVVALGCVPQTFLAPLTEALRVVGL